MESCCCLEYKIDPEPTHTMNTPEPFNDLSWSDDPLHSPNRTIYIEKLRARVKELESENAHMLQVMEAVCAAVKTVLDRTNPGQSLLAKLTALEKEREQIRKENEELKRQILGLQLEWKRDSDQMVKSNLAANRAFSHYKNLSDQLRSSLKECVTLLECPMVEGERIASALATAKPLVIDDAPNPTPHDATERQKE